MRKLSPKQKKFCREYVVSDNAFEACVKAKYSKNYAKAQGYKLLENVGVEKEIERLQEKIRKKAEKKGTVADPIEVLEGYTREERFNPKALVDKKGAFKPLHKLSDEAALCLYGITIKPTGEITYKFGDKRANRDSMAKIMGFMNGKEAIPEFLIDLLKRAGININIQQNNYGTDAVAGLKLLMDSVDGMTRGIPSMHGQNLIEVNQDG